MGSAIFSVYPLLEVARNALERRVHERPDYFLAQADRFRWLLEENYDQADPYT